MVKQPEIIQTKDGQIQITQLPITTKHSQHHQVFNPQDTFAREFLTQWRKTIYLPPNIWASANNLLLWTFASAVDGQAIHWLLENHHPNWAVVLAIIPLGVGIGLIIMTILGTTSDRIQAVLRLFLLGFGLLLG